MFDPRIEAWFTRTFGAPSEPQRRGWPAIAAGHDTLIAAPTGSGKTLAAFLWCIDQLVTRLGSETPPAGVRVLYVSPLRALSHDIAKNLAAPLAGIGAEFAACGAPFVAPTVQVRTGDTPAGERKKLALAPPHILVTTPESLFVLLTSRSGRAALATVETVIVDEIHALVEGKRGAHLALSLERLEALVLAAGRRAPQRIGLSATQRPIELTARLLAGARPLPELIDIGFARTLDLALEVPAAQLGAVATHEMMEEFYDRIVELTASHRTILVFVNTRKLAERVAFQLEQRLGEGHVAPHHGSLSRALRLAAEQRLKDGALKVVVATSSLELGIDIGEVDLVMLLGSPRNISAFLQRVGRSGHALSRIPKGRLFATTRDQLIECAALIRAVRAGVLDQLVERPGPLDVLAQQIVAEVAAEEWDEAALYQRLTRASPYRELSIKDYHGVLEILAEGIASGRGRAMSFLHRDRVLGRLRARKGARLTALTSGGAIPDLTHYDVVADPDDTPVGTLDEDFAIESSAGDIFLLGNTSWRILGLEGNRVRVQHAAGAPPTVPFWRGEAPGRSRELSAEVSRLRAEVEFRLADPGLAAALAAELGLCEAGAEQLVAYLAEGQRALGALPSCSTFVIERFFDDGGGMQLVLHAPLGARINKAWGLALRKCFCRSFDFELQAAATDDGILISLGPVHSFPLDSVFEFLSPQTVREVLVQAVLRTPIFASRWRWVAQRALAVPRMRNGKRLPPQIMRMRSDDLLASVFPGAAACQDNIEGDVELPAHPLVFEAMRDALTEALDVEGLERTLTRLAAGEIRLICKDLPGPSPLAHELLNASPYAFLDDAPLEERRARAVSLRRTLPANLSESLGVLDREVTRAVEAELAPAPRDADELHDLLLSVLLWPAERDDCWAGFFETLVRQGRATRIYAPAEYWVAAERWPWVMALGYAAEPPLGALPFEVEPIEREELIRRLLAGHLELSGPRRLDELAARLPVAAGALEIALAELEASGLIFRAGFFGPEPSYCHRRPFARIQARTLTQLRRAVEPVSPAELMRFLFRWQNVHRRLEGARGLLEVVSQLQGIDASARAWEASLLPLRITNYDPAWLDALTSAGDVGWGRLSERAGGDGVVVAQNACLSLFERGHLPWLCDPERIAEPKLTSVARDVRAALTTRGAAFVPQLAQQTGHGVVEIEAALSELVAAGFVTSDRFEGLRRLLGAGPRLQASSARFGLGLATVQTALPGRWSLLREALPEAPDPSAWAKQLLVRYGVVYRDLLSRETNAPPWRLLLPPLRRLEATGQIRGGHFVRGQTGEQFALKEALELLRGLRPPREPEWVRLSAADPLNLVGITAPGPRVPALADNLVLYRDGVPVLSREGQLVVPREALSAEECFDAELRPVPAGERSSARVS